MPGPQSFVALAGMKEGIPRDFKSTERSVDRCAVFFVSWKLFRIMSVE
jgi:hypothetical protein